MDEMLFLLLTPERQIFALPYSTLVKIDNYKYPTYTKTYLFHNCRNNVYTVSSRKAYRISLDNTIAALKGKISKELHSLIENVKEQLVSLPTVIFLPKVLEKTIKEQTLTIQKKKELEPYIFNKKAFEAAVEAFHYTMKTYQAYQTLYIQLTEEIKTETNLSKEEEEKILKKFAIEYENAAQIEYWVEVLESNQRYFNQLIKIGPPDLLGLTIERFFTLSTLPKNKSIYVLFFFDFYDKSLNLPHSLENKKDKAQHTVLCDLLPEIPNNIFHFSSMIEAEKFKKNIELMSVRYGFYVCALYENSQLKNFLVSNPQTASEQQKETTAKLNTHREYLLLQKNTNKKETDIIKTDLSPKSSFKI